MSSMFDDIDGEEGERSSLEYRRARLALAANELKAAQREKTGYKPRLLSDAEYDTFTKIILGEVLQGTPDIEILEMLWERHQVTVDWSSKMLERVKARQKENPGHVVERTRREQIARLSSSAHTAWRREEFHEQAHLEKVLSTIAGTVAPTQQRIEATGIIVDARGIELHEALLALGSAERVEPATAHEVSESEGAAEHVGAYRLARRVSEETAEHGRREAIDDQSTDDVIGTDGKWPKPRQSTVEERDVELEPGEVESEHGGEWPPEGLQEPAGPLLPAWREETASDTQTRATASDRSRRLAEFRRLVDKTWKTWGEASVALGKYRQYCHQVFAPGSRLRINDDVMRKARQLAGEVESGALSASFQDKSRTKKSSTSLGQSACAARNEDGQCESPAGHFGAHENWAGEFLDGKSTVGGY